MDTRRLVLGDWTAVVRDGIDLLRLSLVAGAAVYVLRGDGGGAAVLAVMACATLVARAVNLPRLYDLTFTTAMVLQGWGEATNRYDELAWFDELTHFVLPMLTAPVLYIALARLDVVPDPKDDTSGKHYVGVFVTTLALGLAFGAAWEIAEWSSDNLLGSSLQEGNDDTVGDLIADGLGALAGAALLTVWTRCSWGSVRRIPGENRYEDAET